MSATNEKQADVLEGAEALPNARGTAPGQLLEHEGRVLVLLPGPPGEMKPMFDEQVLARLRARAGTTRVVRRRVLRIAAMPESEVDEIAAPVYSRFENPKTTILGAVGQVELHLVAHGDGAFEADSRIEELAAALRAALPGRIYAEDGRDLPQVVVGLLRERGLTLALAESCTGGLLCARVTDVPGASAVLERAFVTYANRAKVEETGVDPALLERHGAVSEEVAAALAAGAMKVARADVGVGITGIAGPDGGTAEKPVGLVFVAVRRRGGHARAPQPLPRRPRARALPGDAGGARDAAPRPAGPAAAVSAAETARAFVAIELEAPLREAIGDLQARLRPRLGAVRLVRPEGIHLTLRFLGDTSPAQVETLRPRLAAAAAELPARRGARRRARHCFPSAAAPGSCGWGWRCPRPSSTCSAPASGRRGRPASRRRSARSARTSPSAAGGSGPRGPSCHPPISARRASTRWSSSGASCRQAAPSTRRSRGSRWGARR